MYKTCDDEEGGVGAGEVQRDEGLRRCQLDVQLQRLAVPQHLDRRALADKLLADEVPERDALARPASHSDTAGFCVQSRTWRASAVLDST